MSKNDELYIISGGPTKGELSNSLLKGTTSSRTPVALEVDGIGSVNVCIDKIEREDGSGNSWIIMGWTMFFSEQVQNALVEGCYNTMTTTGTLKLKR